MSDVSGVMLGELYAGQFSFDNQWYRVQITNVGRNDIKALFVDFGNSEQTSVDRLRVLDRSLEKYPGQVSGILFISLL